MKCSYTRAIKFTLKKMKGGSVTRVEITKDDQLVELTTKDAIYNACIEENRDKYSQTSSTPCMTEPLKTLLGRFADTPFSLSVLNGTATFPQATPKYTKD